MLFEEIEESFTNTVRYLKDQESKKHNLEKAMISKEVQIQGLENKMKELMEENYFLRQDLNRLKTLLNMASSNENFEKSQIKSQDF